ncbi:MAG: hypothetical protein H6722_01155 [Sandaracinus sp.]|nr:hypothetical protein [Sandaracinus sp.]MCB9611049.1 hypothetical protein [Sandaracinus sp.]
MKTWPFAVLALTTSLLAPSASLAQDTVVIVEDADGATTRVTTLPYQLPAPTPAPAPAEEAPVVLVLPPGTQVRLLAEELAPPVATPPTVPTPVEVPVIEVPTTLPYAPTTVSELERLRLEARFQELRRQRPSIAFPLSMTIGGGVTTFLSSWALGRRIERCDDGYGCRPIRPAAIALATGIGVLAVGVIRLMTSSSRRRALGLEMREIRRQLAYLRNQR